MKRSPRKTLTDPTASPCQSQKRNSNPHVLTQDELRNWWPFTRVDGKKLDALHRKVTKSQARQAIINTEDALI